MNVIPRKNNVVVSPISETSSIIVTKTKPEFYSVMAIGEDVKGLEVGDKVALTDFGGKHIDVDGVECIIVKEDAILAKII